jgi:hypothetical protein
MIFPTASARSCRAKVAALRDLAARMHDGSLDLTDREGVGCSNPKTLRSRRSVTPPLAPPFILRGAGQCMANLVAETRSNVRVGRTAFR